MYFRIEYLKMSDRLTSAQRHYNMSRIRSANTQPELMLRHLLWRQGFRYRINDKKLPGRPDIVLPKYRTVIFVHGCFWHGHKGCKNYTVPKTNTEFWVAKIARNQERDQEVWRKLEAKGWNVIIVWECQLVETKLADTITRVTEELRANLLSLLHYRKEREEVYKAYLAERNNKRKIAATVKAELIRRG